MALPSGAGLPARTLLSIVLFGRVVAGEVSVGSGVGGAPSVVSLMTNVVFPTAALPPVKLLGVAVGASFVGVTVIAVCAAAELAVPSFTTTETSRVVGSGVFEGLSYFADWIAAWNSARLAGPVSVSVPSVLL